MIWRSTGGRAIALSTPTPDVNHATRQRASENCEGRRICALKWEFGLFCHDNPVAPVKVLDDINLGEPGGQHQDRDF